MASGSSSSSSSSIPMSIFSPTPTVNSSNGDSGVHNVSESLSPTSAIAENDKSDDETLATSATAIQKAFREKVNDPEHLEEAANYMYESLLDDAVVGVVLETHHLRKTGNLPALEGIPEGKSDTSYRIVDLPNYDIFDVSTAKKPMMVCTCPICDRPVSATRFAPHLTNCMGMGRTSSRIASRRLATKEGTGAGSSSYMQANAATDDEDDADWSSEKRRKKTNQNSRNGSKKNNNNKTF